MVIGDKGRVGRERSREHEGGEAPTLLEQVYTMEDALVFGGMAISLLNHADRVKIGPEMTAGELHDALAPLGASGAALAASAHTQRGRSQRRRSRPRPPLPA